jgi:hypothetical protein
MMRRSSQRISIGVTGILIAVSASLLYIVSNNNQAFPLLSLFLWIIGIIFLLWWFKHESSLKLKFTMGIIFAGQILMFLFSERFVDENNNLILNRYFLFSLLLLGIGISYFIAVSRKKNTIRQYFSSKVKSQILKKQNYKCATCKKFLNVYDFDHKDNDRSNNSYRNCQALCPICHAIKTRKLKS